MSLLRFCILRMNVSLCITDLRCAKLCSQRILRVLSSVLHRMLEERSTSAWQPIYMTHDRMFNLKSLISRQQKNQSCQSHLSTKQSSPSTPAPGDHLLQAGDILNQASILHVMLTPASMVTRPPGVPPCIMETPTAYQLLITRFIRHINPLLIPFTLIILHLLNLITIQHLTHLLLRRDTQGQFTHTGDQASTNSFSRFIRLSCISAGNG